MISFVIPAKNEEKYISDCLKSIYSQTSDEKFEVIVVDNMSTDRTAEIVKKDYPQAIVVQETVCGTNSARQRGFLESRGDLMIFLDADVHLREGWLQRIIDKTRAWPDVVGLSSVYKYYDFKWYWNWGNEILIRVFIYPWSVIMINWLGWAAQMIGGVMVIKKTALTAIGGLDTHYKFFGDDTGTAFRLKKVGRVVFLPELWVYTSARRYNKRGVLRMFFVYMLNYFWLQFTWRPWNKNGYEIVR